MAFSNSTPFFSRIPVVDLHKENWASLWPSLKFAVQKADFVALDLVSQVQI